MYPILRETAITRQMITAFGGFNNRPGAAENEFCHMENLTSDHYPLLATREGRTPVKTGVEAMISKDGLCTVEGGKFYISGHETGLTLTDGPKQLVGMGAWVIVLPDRKYINTIRPEEFGTIDAAFESAEPVVAELCDLEGNVYRVATGDAPPEDADLTWVDTTTDPATVRTWSAAYNTWSALPSVYVRLSCPGIGKAYAQYDGVTLSGFQDIHLTGLNSSAVIWSRGDDYIVVVGVIPGRVVEEATVTVARTMPQLDFVVEYQNRLWGCRYGLDGAGQPVNEIYASAQGDFKNWERFMGLESDSYRVSCGTDGPFTGAAVVQNHPLFFKEDHMHIVYGSAMPFQVQAVRCRGVAADAGASPAVVDEVLYYKSREGICAYDGSLPTLVSQGVPISGPAVGGSFGGKYYVSSENGLFVLDTRRGLWHREDDLAPSAFCESGGRLYAIAGGQLLDLTGGEEGLPFLAESGLQGLSRPDQTYLHGLLLRLKLEGRLTLEVRYDDGPWQVLYSLQPAGLRSYELMIHPRRCDHFAYRLSGKGRLRLYSLTKYWEKGSDKP